MAGRPTPRLAAVRRALGATLARRRPLRRHARLRQGQAPPQRLAVPRLCHPRLQQRQAVRTVRARTGRRRRALPGHPRRHRGDRVHRGRPMGFHRPRRGAGVQARRPDRPQHRPGRHGEKHDEHLHQHHGAMRPLPRPQVRRGQHDRLLPDAGRLCRARPRRPRISPRAGDRQKTGVAQNGNCQAAIRAEKDRVGGSIQGRRKTRHAKQGAQRPSQKGSGQAAAGVWLSQPDRRQAGHNQVGAGRSRRTPRDHPNHADRCQ